MTVLASAIGQLMAFLSLALRQFGKRFCQPKRGDLISMDTWGAKQVMWLHTHRPVILKLAQCMRVVLLQGRGQNTAMPPDTHPPGPSVAWTGGTNRAQHEAPPTEMAQWAFSSSHLPIGDSSSTLTFCRNKINYDAKTSRMPELVDFKVSNIFSIIYFKPLNLFNTAL